MGSSLNGPVVGVGDQSLLNELNGWAKSWQKDLNIFKSVCKKGRQSVLLTEDDLKALPPQTNNDDSDQSNMMKRKLQEEEEEDNIKRVKKTTELGFRAIQKENNLEQMIQSEETEKGREELAILKVKINEEKKKLECLHKNNVEEKVIDDVDSKAEEREIKAKFQLKIAQKRQKMKGVLEGIRRKNRIKRSQLDQELKELKAKVAGDLLRANYIGEIQRCIRGKTDLDFRDTYCNKVWVDSYITNKDCHSNEEWCEMCCQHEFGNLYMSKRYECYDTCDAKVDEVKPKVNNLQQPGKWQWIAKYKTGGDLTNPTKVGPSSQK
jgi:hypothetical protein